MATAALYEVTAVQRQLPCLVRKVAELSHGHESQRLQLSRFCSELTCVLHMLHNAVKGISITANNAYCLYTDKLAHCQNWHMKLL